MIPAAVAKLVQVKAWKIQV